MYYNRILRIWVLNAFDYFLLGIIIGSFVALKKYSLEKKVIERLKNYTIKKSELKVGSDRLILNSKKTKIKKVYKFALKINGG